MSKVRIINAGALPNIPWQDRPADLKTESPVWRYSENPVMGRNPTPEIARIFNSAVVPWEDGYIAVLRGEQVNGVPYVYLGHSRDGIRWDDTLEYAQGFLEIVHRHGNLPRIGLVEAVADVVAGDVAVLVGTHQAVDQISHVAHLADRLGLILLVAGASRQHGCGE